MVEQEGRLISPETDTRGNDRLYQAIHRHVVARANGTACEQDDVQFDKLVRENPRARAMYANYLLQTVSLRAWAKAESDVTVASIAAHTDSPLRIRVGVLDAMHPRRHPWKFATVALLLTVAGWALFYVMTKPPAVSPVAGATADDLVFVAQLTELQNAVWVEGQTGTTRGTHLQRGHQMQLLAGLVEITFRNNVRIVVEGPATLVLDDRNECTLHEGALTATVPPAARGFAIDTPSARVVDFGTEFGVRVEESGACDVQVFTGRVVVASVRDDTQQSLTAGSATRVSDSGTFEPIAAARVMTMRRLVRNLPALPNSDGETIAYVVQRGVVGNQDFRGSLGHDFIVNRPLEVTRLGVFDSGADGLARPLTSELWRRDEDGQRKLIELTFTPDDPGELAGGSRFKRLREPFQLPPGDYTMVAHGYGPEELVFNSGTNVILKRYKRANTGDDAVTYTGASRYGDAGLFPDHPDDHVDPARYGAGTFAFREVPPDLD